MYITDLTNPCDECLVSPICQIRQAQLIKDRCEIFEKYDGYRVVINCYHAALEKIPPRNKMRKRFYLDEIKRLKKEYNEWYKTTHSCSCMAQRIIKT